MTIAIIGIGLIGGSLSIALRQNHLADRIIAVDADATHGQKAIELGLADDYMPLAEALAQSDIVLVAIPVDATVMLLPELLSLAGDKVIVDMGSAKGLIIEAVQLHPNRRRFVAAHPMAGTEFSGPAAAIPGLFTGKACVICNREDSDQDALKLAEDLFRGIQMHIVYMDAQAHDIHAAYVSHISHISSFALANTVLEKEKEEEAIFELASGGFESTVRLAKSNPDMWLPIFKQNRDNVLDVLNEHIGQLRKFKVCLEKENYAYLRELMESANKIKRIIK